MSGAKTNDKGQTSKTIHIASLGCPKNRVDSEVMAGAALEGGLRLVSDPGEADVIVVNTCGFIGDAKEESVNALLEMSSYKKNGRCELLVAAGCLSQLHGDDMAEALPELDRVIGANQPDQLMKVIGESAPKLEIGEAGHFLQQPGTPRFVQPGSSSAYIKIADGCSRKCAFCIIPSIRGKAASRPVKEIVAEAESLVSKGILELNLVAQDTAAYGADLGDGTDLVSLVTQLDKIKGLKWVRLLYLYPDSVPNSLLRAMSNLETLVPYLDVPIQHSSSEMLKKMHRGHGLEVLSNLLKRARDIVPNIFLRTTVLVGHPGETKQDMDHLVEFIAQAKFSHLGAFRYSNVEGTLSYGQVPQVSKRDSYNRWRRVMAAQGKVAKKNARTMIGKTVQVLVEESADDQGFVLQGRHQGQAPDIDGITYIVSCEAVPGDIITAKIIDCKVHDLIAEPIADPK